MDIAWRILTNTPIWVFAVAGTADLARKPVAPAAKDDRLRRLLIVPMVFLLMGLSRLIFAGGQYCI